MIDSHLRVFCVCENVNVRRSNQINQSIDRMILEMRHKKSACEEKKRFFDMSYATACSVCLIALLKLYSNILRKSILVCTYYSYFIFLFELRLACQ